MIAGISLPRIPRERERSRVRIALVHPRRERIQTVSRRARKQHASNVVEEREVVERTARPVPALLRLPSPFYFSPRLPLFSLPPPRAYALRPRGTHVDARLARIIRCGFALKGNNVRHWYTRDIVRRDLRNPRKDCRLATFTRAPPLASRQEQERERGCARRRRSGALE